MSSLFDAFLARGQTFVEHSVSDGIFDEGLFSGTGYDVRTNSEQGTGRADIVIKEQSRRRAIVIETKWTGKRGDSLERECADALEQIKEKQYMKKLQTEGYMTVLCYGAAFCGKTCLIKLADENV